MQRLTLSEFIFQRITQDILSGKSLDFSDFLENNEDEEGRMNVCRIMKTILQKEDWFESFERIVRKETLGFSDLRQVDRSEYKGIKPYSGKFLMMWTPDYKQYFHIGNCYPPVTLGDKIPL